MRILAVSFFGLALVALLIVPFVGCESASAPAVVPATNPADDASSVDLAGLSDADREAVLAQKFCPVSGEPLGTMGMPPKVVVEGREVFICCESCEDALKAEPAKYLTKLDE